MSHFQQCFSDIFVGANQQPVFSIRGTLTVNASSVQKHQNQQLSKYNPIIINYPEKDQVWSFQLSKFENSPVFGGHHFQPIL